MVAVGVEEAEEAEEAEGEEEEEDEAVARTATVTMRRSCWDRPSWPQVHVNSSSSSIYRAERARTIPERFNGRVRTGKGRNDGMDGRRDAREAPATFLACCARDGGLDLTEFDHPPPHPPFWTTAAAARASTCVLYDTR